MEVNSSCFSFAVSLILWLLFCLCLLFSELFHIEQKDFQERALSTTISTISAARLRCNWCSNFFEILWIKAAPHNSWQSHKAVKMLEKYLNPISWHWIITGIAHSQSQPRGAAFVTELCACSRGLSRAGGFTLNGEGIYGDVLWQGANPSSGGTGVEHPAREALRAGGSSGFLYQHCACEMIVCFLCITLGLNASNPWDFSILQSVF